jgi:signal transduction histidine kinase
MRDVPVNVPPVVKFPVSILCVDDEPVNLDILTRLLSRYVETIYFAANGQEGHTLYLEKRPDIVLTDLVMPVLSGLEMSCLIRSSEPKVPIILLTSCNSVDFLAEAIDIGITQYLPKPVLKEKLLTAIQRCYDIISLERRLKEEHERAEAHLLRTLKLESLGVLAGGVAHNFNNILTAIIGNANLAMMNLPQDSPAVQYLVNIESSSLRAAEIAKQMLDFSGKGSLTVVSINLNEMLQSMRSLLESAIPKSVTAIFDFGSALCRIKGDPDQLRQVITSLTINAAESLEGGQGTIRISTGSVECDRAFFTDCWFDEGTPEGSYIFLEVSDSGCGMDKEVIAKMFDPFFSTKFTGRGLGMAAVLGIVRWHKGAIHIVSSPGKGSTFRILLPAIPEAAN